MLSVEPSERGVEIRHITWYIDRGFYYPKYNVSITQEITHVCWKVPVQDTPWVD